MHRGQYIFKQLCEAGKRGTGRSEMQIQQIATSPVRTTSRGAARTHVPGFEVVYNLIYCKSLPSTAQLYCLPNHQTHVPHPGTNALTGGCDKNRCSFPSLSRRALRIRTSGNVVVGVAGAHAPRTAVLAVPQLLSASAPHLTCTALSTTEYESG